MSKTDEFLQWCESHKLVLPNLRALDLAHEAVYELQRAGLLLSEELDVAQTKIIKLEHRIRDLQNEVVKNESKRAQEKDMTNLEARLGKKSRMEL